MSGLPGDNGGAILGRPIAKLFLTFPQLTNTGIKVCLQLGASSPVHHTLNRIKQYLEQELQKETEKSRRKVISLTRVGLDTLSIALSVRTDHQVDTKIADIGYDILQDIIKRGDTVMLPLQAKTIAAGLRKIASQNENWVDSLLGRRAEAFEASIIDAKWGDPEKIEKMELLSQSISALVAAATELNSPDQLMEVKFSRYWVRALRNALDRGCEKQVDRILDNWSTEFRSAVDDEVRSPFQSYSLYKSERVVFRVAMSDDPNGLLVTKLTTFWLGALNDATTYSASAVEKVEGYIKSWPGEYKSQLLSEDYEDAKETSKAVAKLLLGAVEINKLKRQFADQLVRMIERVLEKVMLQASMKDELLSSLFRTILEAAEAGDDRSILTATREELLLRSRAFPSVEKEIIARLS